MGKIYITEPPSPIKRAAAYVRVSLETDKLRHSLAAQTRYFSDLIRSNPEWVQAGIYSDSFISGTDSSRRSGFKRLITDCEQGRIDIVLCKSISRFARNTVDLLETVRRLKRMGVEVRFEKENISSLSAEGELMLTILASFAQEESRSISENVKWGIRRRFQSGEAEMRNKAVFGYRFDGEKYVVCRDEAETVRRIYQYYISGMSLRGIAQRISDTGAKTVRGLDFSPGAINYIVRNEIYTGDILLQKTFVKDFITHTRAQNHGELPQYRIRGCHEPIIDEETFALAQEEVRRRAAPKPVYCFSKKLICGGCGRYFTRVSNRGKYARWHCRSCLGIKLGEDRLIALLGMTPEEISEQVSAAEVSEGGVIDVKFYDGRTKTWQYE